MAYFATQALFTAQATTATSAGFLAAIASPINLSSPLNSQIGLELIYSTSDANAISGRSVKLFYAFSNNGSLTCDGTLPSTTGPGANFLELKTQTSAVASVNTTSLPIISQAKYLYAWLYIDLIGGVASISANVTQLNS